MSENLKTMKAPVVEVRVEKRYIVSVAGMKLGSFREADTMCNMKQLVGSEGTLVIDVPSSLDEVLATLFAAGQSEPFKAAVIKASPAIIQAMQDAINAMKAQPKDEPRTAGRTPVETPEVETPEGDEAE